MADSDSLEIKIGKKELMELVSNAVDTALENRSMPGHADDHDWIELQRKRWQDRQEAWQKFKMSFIGSSALALVSFLGWIGTLVWEMLYNKPGG